MGSDPERNVFVRLIMERFCDKCGTLVQGEGKFCPSCGAPLESAVDLSKPAAPATEPMQSAPTVNTYTSPNAAQMPAYPQSYNNGGMIERTEDMSVGQWALTIFLSSLSLIGIILLFVWAFSGDTPQPKKNYARGMLIIQAVMLGIVILFYIGAIVCTFSCIGMDEFDRVFGCIRQSIFG